MTIEGAKEQDGRFWSQVIELDRGGSTSQDRESEGKGSDKVREGMEKDPKIGVGLEKGTECKTSCPERLVMLGLVIVEKVCEVEREEELRVDIEEG